MPLQIPVGFKELLSVGVGFTMMVNETAAPEQVFEMAVTVISAVIGAAVPLTAVNALIFPEPDADNPIEVVLFVQL